ncbi:MAG: hypothetical protein PHO70_04760 [Candidatus Omnitrophica bacterium]|nr:hypothetical protein [Candidatus Omnitrophota bacterium]
MKISFLIFPVIILIFFLSVITFRTYFNLPLFVEKRYVLISYAQFLMPLLTILILLTLPLDFKKIYGFILNIGIPLIIFAIFEQIIPVDFKMKFLEKFKLFVPVGLDGSSYLIEDFGIKFFRSGSFFFSPLTLGLFSAELLIISFLVPLSRSNKIIIFLSLCLSFVKSAVILIGLFLISIFAKRKVLFFYFFLILVLFVCLFVIFDHSDFSHVDTTYGSLGCHYSGLVLGAINGFVHPFLGHGTGTAGYLIYSQAVNDGNIALFNNTFDKVLSSLSTSNGNESFIGIMFYQFGFLFFLLYLWIIFLLSKELFIKNRFVAFGFVFGFFLIGFFSESVITIVLSVVANIISVGEFRAS